MSPWQHGKKRDPSSKPILKYFTEDSNKEFYICKVSSEDDDGNEIICGAKLKIGGTDSNIGNSLEIKKKLVYIQFKFLHFTFIFINFCQNC